MNLSRVALLPTSLLTGTWYRAIQMRHLSSPLATRHTTTNPGRFNGGTISHPGPEVLYLTEDTLVAEFEVGSLLGSPLGAGTFVPSPKSLGWTFLAVSVVLQKVVDLKQSIELGLIDTSIQELTGDWFAYGLRPTTRTTAAPYWSDVPSQQLGAALEASGIEALLTYSAKVPTKSNLVIFRNNLLPGSKVTCLHPTTGASVVLP